MTAQANSIVQGADVRERIATYRSIVRDAGIPQQ
jgi:hypothetical protein